jgi:hypothetical protein
MTRPLLVLISVLLSIPAHAAWEAKVDASTTGNEFKPMSGTIYQNGSAIRVDTNYTMDMSFYAKTGSTKVDAAVPTLFVRLKKDALPAAIPACLGASFAACTKDLKLKRTGTEKCGDRSCEVWSGSPAIRNVKSVKVWHWAGEAEPILSKAVVTKKNGSVITANFSGVKRTSHPDAFYLVPSRYKDAGPLERWVGDLRGKSE